MEVRQHQSFSESASPERTAFHLGRKISAAIQIIVCKLVQSLDIGSFIFDEPGSGVSLRSMIANQSKLLRRPYHPTPIPRQVTSYVIFLAWVLFRR